MTTRLLLLAVSAMLTLTLAGQAMAQNTSGGLLTSPGVQRYLQQQNVAPQWGQGDTRLNLWNGSQYWVRPGFNSDPGLLGSGAEDDSYFWPEDSYYYDNGQWYWRDGYADQPNAPYRYRGRVRYQFYNLAPDATGPPGVFQRFGGRGLRWNR